MDAAPVEAVEAWCAAVMLANKEAGADSDADRGRGGACAGPAAAAASCSVDSGGCFRLGDDDGEDDDDSADATGASFRSLCLDRAVT